MSLMKMASVMLKQHIFEMVDVAFPVDDTTFATKGSNLFTVLKLEGVGFTPGSEEFINVTTAFYDQLKPLFEKSGNHTVSLTFDKDAEFTERSLQEGMAGSIQTAKRLNFDVEDIIKESVDVMCKFTTFEQAYIVVWTHLNAGDPDIVKSKVEKSVSALKEIPFSIRDSVNPLTYIDAAYDKHVAVVESLQHQLSLFCIILKTLPVVEAARAMKVQLEKDVTSNKWRPTMFGDKLTKRIQVNASPAERASDIMWPRMDYQLARAPHIDVEGHDEIIKIGSTFYSPLYVEAFPKDVVRFNQLFNLIDKNISYRVNFTISKHKPMSHTYKTIANSFFKWANSNNKLISNSLKSIENEPETVGFQMVIVVSSKDKDKLIKDREKVIRAMQSWGADVVMDIEDPSEMVVTTTTGMSHKNPSTISLPPLVDAILMLPVMRPASHWENGTMLFKSQDGKALTYMPGSPIQESMNDLMVAKPRQGKSVLSQSINFALCIKPGIQEFPYIGIIDIGPSSEGFIKLLRDSLPAKRKHLAIHHKLQNVDTDTINFMDIQFGLKKPLPIERTYIVNMLCLMATSEGESSPPKDMSDLVAMVVDEAFSIKSDKMKANKYRTSVNTDIDAYIADKYFTTSDYTSWYDIRDFLFDHEEYVLSNLAQLRAVPCLSDLPSIAESSESIQRMYGAATGDGSLLHQFKQKITSILRDYPVFSNYTQLDFGNARIIALDLNDVAPKGSDAAIKQTSIMCMLARFLVAKNFYLSEEHVDNWDSRYRGYQKARIKDIQASEKRLVIDEFHRYKDISAVPSQFETDQKEGGKWGVQTCAISQEVNDFSEGMVKNATNTYILGTPKAAEVIDLERLIGLSPTEKAILKSNRLHGPRSGGACFLHRFDTKNGSFSHVLNNPKGPIELWSYSTTRKDMALRSYLTEKLGIKACRASLALAFPSGSAAVEIEKLMGGDFEFEDDLIGVEDDKLNIIGKLGDEVAEKYITSLN